MIKYNLKCLNNHEFESWFADSSEFEKLKKKNLLECIYCESKKIKKSIMSPMIAKNTTSEDQKKDVNQKFSNEKKKLVELRKFIEKNFEFVGNNFGKKVREIYYDKKNKKNIYGSTTADERKELAEEGIDLISVPWVSKDN